MGHVCWFGIKGSLVPVMEWEGIESEEKAD